MSKAKSSRRHKETRGEINFAITKRLREVASKPLDHATISGFVPEIRKLWGASLPDKMDAILKTMATMHFAPTREAMIGCVLANNIRGRDVLMMFINNSSGFRGGRKSEIRHIMKEAAR